jgi:hypothetical protein
MKHATMKNTSSSHLTNALHVTISNGSDIQCAKRWKMGNLGIT